MAAYITESAHTDTPALTPALFMIRNSLSKPGLC